MQPTLAETQRYLWRLITAPEGVAAGLASLGDEDPRLAERLEQIVAGDRRLSARQRLDIYANMYFYRLLDSLREDYPAVCAVVGAGEFHNAITDYLLAHPPSHPSLRYAGRHVPRFLRAHRLAEERPWLPALAELEWAILDAFDAADGPTLAAEDLERLAPESWAAARLTPTASLRLLEVDWRVDDVWDRTQRGEPPGDAEAIASALQIWRRDLRVYHRPLEALERDCLRLLLAGEPFAAWCDRAAAAAGEDAAAEEVVSIVRRWLNEGVLAAVQPAAPGA
jgi:hypothetical protein